MQTKIDPQIWLTWQPYPVGTRMAMIWMLTNRDLTTAGFCLATKAQFEFETLLDWSHFERACEAFEDEIFIVPEKPKAPSIPDASGGHPASIPHLSRTHPASIPDASGTNTASVLPGESTPAPLIARRYWLKNFIRKQYAEDGPRLCKNKVSGAIVRAVVAAHSEPLKAAVLAEYPSLKPLFSSFSDEKTNTSGSGMHPGSIPDASHQRGEERSGEERHGEEGVQRESQEPHAPSSPENKKPGGPEDIVPAPEVLQRLGPIFGRQKNARFSDVEENLAMSLHASEEELALVEAYYRVAVAEPKVFFPKRSLYALLADFPSQCDRARGHFAEDPLFSPQKNSAAAPEPEGWREVVLAKYPRALVHEYRSWFDLSRDIRREFPQFPEDRHPAKKPASAPEPAVCGPTPAAA
jgi:hypothetical protein